MSIPPGVTKVSINGHLGAYETFSVGFWCEGNTPTTLAAANTWAVGIAGYVPTYLGAAATNLLDSNSGYDEVQVYAYPDGGPSALVTAVAPIAGMDGTGLGSLPLQSAFCITTQTPFIGRRRRGRMYVPAVGLVLTTSHQIETTVAQAAVDAFAALLDHISTSSVMGDPVVVSQIGVGSTALITALRADTKLDVQRRRADDQTPTAVVTAGV